MKTTSTATQRSQSLPSYDECVAATANPDGSPRILRFQRSGLMLYVWKSGRKAWRCKVQRGARRTMLTLGYFPKVSIKQAQKALAIVREAKDPIEDQRAAVAEKIEARGNSFRDVAARWLDVRAAKAHWEDDTRRAYQARLDNDVFPAIGDRPIAEVSLDDILALISKIVDDGKGRKRPSLAVSIKQIVSNIFDFAIRWRLATMNPVEIIAEDLPIREPETHHPHMARIEDARRALAAVESRAARMTPQTVLAHRLIALTGCRKMEVLEARWTEFDLDAGWWTIPAERMKGKHGKRREHHVALSPQAIEVLVVAKRIAGPKRGVEFVFPSETTGRGGRRSSDGLLNRCTLNEIMERAGVKMTPHGWRSTFSTIMNERDASRFRVVDVMLAHSTFRDSVDGARRKGSEGSYNRAVFESPRHAIACEWADLLLEGAPTASALMGLDGAARTTTNGVTLRAVA